MIVKMYTDGACSGNPGPGGWAVVYSVGSECKQFSGGEKETTNNRMELTAMLKCLRLIIGMGSKKDKYEIYSDSAYVVNAINNDWIQAWMEARWRTKTKEQLKNKDLWKLVYDCLDKLLEQGKDVQIIKIKGHSGNTFNELCDKIAKSMVEKVKTRK